MVLSPPLIRSLWLGSLAWLALASSIAPTITQAADKPADKGNAKQPEKLPGELTWKTERVIVFKDGYCLVIKHGKATSNSTGEVFTDEVPDSAVLGSFWAVPLEGRLESMVAGWKTTEEAVGKDVRCKETLEILQANEGKQAKIELHDKSTYSGTILEVLSEKGVAAVGPPTADDPFSSLPALLPIMNGLASGRSAKRTVLSSASADTSSRTLSTITGANFILRTDDGDVLLPASQVRSMVIKEMKTKVEKVLTTTKRVKRLTFKCTAAEKAQGITLMYFRPGIRWIPTYRADLTPELAAAGGAGPQQRGGNAAARAPLEKVGKQASLTLQAELLNEAEDLGDVPLDIVVGVPNFRFKDTPSPLILEAMLRNTLNEAAPIIMGQQISQMTNNFSNGAYSARSSEVRRAGALGNGVDEGGIVNLPGELTAGGAQDLFVYNLPKMTLGKGDRSATTIFSTIAPYKDIYTWDVHFQRNTIETTPGGTTNSPLQLSKNQVWHQIVLTNTTNVPWTTGAVMLMQGNQPLAQELLTYTAPTDEVRVPVTVSVDTRGSYTEKETGRELSVLQWNGYNYAKVSKEASLSLCNHKKIEVEVEISLRLGGKAIEATNDGKIIIGAFNGPDWHDYKGHTEVNNSSTISWKIKLKPGEVFEPKVKYFYYGQM